MKLSDSAGARGIVNWLLLTVTVVAAAASVVLFRAYDSHRSAVAAATASGLVATDLDGNAVEWEAAPDLAGTAPKSTGGRFVARRQGLNVDLLSIQVIDGLVVPPTMTDAFLVRDYGRPDDASSGLVVVAMHSVRGGRGPGNALVQPPATPQRGDATGGRARIHSGDELVVDDVRYTVLDTMVASKGAAARDPRIWKDWQQRGDELVILTCLLDPRVPMQDQDNLVVFAHRSL